MRFEQVTISVNNMEKSIEFYKDLLGLEIQHNIDTQEMKLVFLGNGDTMVELMWTGKAVENVQNQNISMGFVCDDLDKTLETMKTKGYKILTRIIEPNPHVKFFFISDPDGYKIQFLEHIK